MKDHGILSLSENCTGCFACFNICPKDAISMPENFEGFYFPRIDTDKCIDCGLCDRICPVLNKPQYRSFHRAYYLKSYNDEILKSSSSGGAFHLLATYIIINGGVVYGASFNYDGILRLECHSTDEVSLDALKKSKYVQSYIGHAFRKVKTDLNAGRRVLFCGTPCQISGLKSFLGEDYKELTTVDFICHGVPPMSLLRKHLEYKGLKNITNINFRPKHRAWVDYFEINYKNRTREKIWRVPYKFDEYFDSFENCQNIRRSCRDCTHCNGNRAADITLADFWGVIKFNTELYDPKGLSLVLINTEKGRTEFDNAITGSDFNVGFVPREYAEYVYQRRRFTPDSPYQNKTRDKFFADLSKMGYQEALNVNGVKKSKISLTKYKLRTIIRQLLKGK